MSKSNKRVAWLTLIIGVDGNLLYFEPIFKAFSEEYDDFCIFTAEYKRGNKDNGLNVQQCGKLKRLYKNVRDAINKHNNQLC